jgi:hypothetical protein
VDAVTLDWEPFAGERPKPDRNARRRAEIAAGWVKAGHAALDHQCDDAAAADYDRPRCYVQPCLPGFEGHRW